MLKFLGIIGLLAILAAIGAAAFFFGGFFNIAANHPDPDGINKVIEMVRDAAVARHATENKAPGGLDDQATIQAGAKAYSQRGCVYCHGGPGAEWAKFSEGLNPGPPDLKDAVGDLSVQEIFWVVRNGIKMTGMPSFAASDPPVPDDEIWKIAAFVKKIPDVKEEDYKAWTASPDAH